MPRVSENQQHRTLISAIQKNHNNVAKFSNELTTGLKVVTPGDSNVSGTISRYLQSLDRIKGYKTTTASVNSRLTYQDDVLNEASDVLTRAKEIAEEAASGTISPAQRATLAEEVFQIRDHMVSLANSTYNGRYVWGGTSDGTPPYTAATYTTPATGPESQRYVYTADPGGQVTNNVQVSDDLSVKINTPGDQVWGNSIEALERLGRAMKGFNTNPAVGAPDGTGAAMVFPTDYAVQTQNIAGAMDLLETGRAQDLVTERVSIGGRLRRIESAQSVLSLAQTQGEDVINKLQNADAAESAVNLTQAQSALNASLTVTTKLLSQSILDYL